MLSQIAFTATLKVAPPVYTRKKRDFDSTAPQPVRGIIRPTISPDGTQLAFAALDARVARGEDVDYVSALGMSKTEASSLRKVPEY